MEQQLNACKTRDIEQIIKGQETADGAGFRLTRVFANELSQRLDPFLMLDAFNNDDPDEYIAGFPNHPHRGFETITYMLAGQMRHNDNAGNEGIISAGGMQWMTAGRGVIHSEFPEQTEGKLAGFQLWLNLAASDKMKQPWYRDFNASEIPALTTSEGVEVTVLAGNSQGVEGAIQREKTLPLYLDLHFQQEGKFFQPLPQHFTAFIYVYQGSASVAGKVIPVQSLGLLEKNSTSSGVLIEAQQGDKMLLIAGQPLNEPIVQYGPFVMNSQQEIIQAMRDYQSGNFE